MKQVIPFKKDLFFKTRISEVTSISLEHNLSFDSVDHITGEFIINGDYKITDVSVNRENFLFSIPFDINLDSKYDLKNAAVDINDFYYEIINNEVLRVNIEVLIEGIEIITEPQEELAEDLIKEVDELEEELELIREDTTNDVTEEMEEERNNSVFQEIETPPVAVSKPVINEEKIKSLFDSFDDKDETFSTYHVYIVRKDDTIDSIAARYSITKEELSLYNNIEELKIGEKIIVPANQNE